MSKSKKKSKGKDSKFFSSNTKKGEIREILDELCNPKLEVQRDAIKRVIALMTVGKDVSMLFPQVVNCMQTCKSTTHARTALTCTAGRAEPCPRTTHVPNLPPQPPQKIANPSLGPYFFYAPLVSCMQRPHTHPPPLSLSLARLPPIPCCAPPFIVFS